MSKNHILFLKTIFLFIFVNAAIAKDVFTWQDCLREALQNHPDLISAEEAINQDKADKIIAQSANLPQVDANLDAQNQETSTSTVNSYSYGASGTQLIFDGFKTLNNINAAKEDIKASQQAYRFTSSQIRLDLRTAFINLLKAQGLIRVAEDIVSIRKKSLVLISLRYYSGLEHKGALLTAEANLASANYELSQARRSIESAEWQLNKEMGRRQFRPMRVDGDFIVREDMQKQPDITQLALSNPSLLEAVAQKNSAAFDIKSAYANFAPELSGSFSGSKTGSKWPPDNSRRTLGLNVSLPLFEGGLRHAQLTQAKAAYRQLEADERSTKDGILVALERAWVALEDAIETTGVQQKALEAALERSKIAEAQYSNGFITFDNWIIIENNLVAAKKAYIEAQANALQTEANWIQAKGETLEYAQ